MRWLAVDGDAAGEVAGVRGQEESGERPQQRRLARPARPDEQHALPRGDDQVEVGEDRLAAAVGAPRQPADLDRRSRRAAPAAPGRGRHGCDRRQSRTRQTARCSLASWPGGKALSAPAAASALVSSHPPTPAMTAPDAVRMSR